MYSKARRFQVRQTSSKLLRAFGGPSSAMQLLFSGTGGPPAFLQQCLVEIPSRYTCTINGCRVSHASMSTCINAFEMCCRISGAVPNCANMQESLHTSKGRLQSFSQEVQPAGPSSKLSSSYELDEFLLWLESNCVFLRE